MAKKKTPVEPPAKQDGLNAKVRGIEVRLSSVVKYLEKTFLADVDGDGNVAGHLRVMIAAALLIGVSIIGITHAATVWNLRDSADAYNVIAVGDDGAFVVQSADGTATLDVDASGGLTATDLTVGDDVAIGGMVNITPTALALTNAATVTVADGVYLVTPGGGPADGTNTVTLANATTSGDQVTFIIAAGATNLLAIADSGIVKLSAAFLGGDDDVLSLIAVGTNWVEQSRSAN